MPCRPPQAFLRRRELHGLRPQYAQMSLNIDQADQQAVNKIAQYRQQVQKSWENK